MTSDSHYLLVAAHQENSFMSNEIHHLRKEIARLLVELDESKDICSRLANSLSLWIDGKCDESNVREIMNEYFAEYGNMKEGKNALG